MTITVSTDGSALGNPNGPMGWAWADHTDGDEASHHHGGDCDAGGATNGTNQIGELCAVLQALRAHPGSEPLIIETDSQYAINCSTKWVHGWKKNGWKNSKKEPVKNAPLIKAIDAELRDRAGSVTFVWVKGHAGNEGNEKVDLLARTYAEDARSHARDGYLPREGWQSLLESPYAKGTDVPMDAQMLLDGTMSETDYTAVCSMGGAAPTVDDNGAVAESDTKPTTKPAQSDATAKTVKHSVKPKAESSGTANNPESFTQDPATSSAVDSASQSPAAPLKVPQAQSHPQPTTVDVATATQAAAPAAQHTAGSRMHVNDLLHATGIEVSGTLHMTPPPESSPTFDGSPRPVHGWIRVEGYVQGDGTLELKPQQFLMESRH
ncbi:ribonuclease H family protein [Bifidobacterium gallicum]|nr:ribonuclease H [Bifidobacterium gallicum]KFI59689.1 ribonuclease H [Bifidobacterium gallicum DSM 20093 = LMG 11596]